MGLEGWKDGYITRATVTSLINLLEAKGLCVREQSTANRRLVLVELTLAGEALIKQVFPVYLRRLADIIESRVEDLALVETTDNGSLLEASRPMPTTGWSTNRQAWRSWPPAILPCSSRRSGHR